MHTHTHTHFYLLFFLVNLVYPIPYSLSDYRPISVTPILSRIVENYIGKRFLSHAIPPHAISDQFVFKPTVSTTCALVCLQHHISFLLEICSYVRCLTVDFSKAFDTIDHAVLLSKLCSLLVPGSVINWIIDFLTGRQQICRV